MQHNYLKLTDVSDCDAEFVEEGLSFIELLVEDLFKEKPPAKILPIPPCLTP